jgi:hypothetical protein
MRPIPFPLQGYAQPTSLTVQSEEDGGHAGLAGSRSNQQRYDRFWHTKGFRRTPSGVACGTSSCKSLSRFASSLSANQAIPVTLRRMVSVAWTWKVYPFFGIDINRVNHLSRAPGSSAQPAICRHAG